jgi:hypothetical protein
MVQSALHLILLGSPYFPIPHMPQISGSNDRELSILQRIHNNSYNFRKSFYPSQVLRKELPDLQNALNSKLSIPIYAPSAQHFWPFCVD